MVVFIPRATACLPRGKLIMVNKRETKVAELRDQTALPASRRDFVKAGPLPPMGRPSCRPLAAQALRAPLLFAGTTRRLSCAAPVGPEGVAAKRAP